jgi:hypothetical protein
MACEIGVVLEQYERKLSLAECCQRETPVQTVIEIRLGVSEMRHNI